MRFEFQCVKKEIVSFPTARTMVAVDSHAIIKWSRTEGNLGLLVDSLIIFAGMTGLKKKMKIKFPATKN